MGAIGLNGDIIERPFADRARAVTAKIEIVQKLGEQALLLPSLLAEALAANDRLKLRLTLLQEAVSHSRHPEAEPRTFETERHAAGLADAQYDATVSGARIVSGDHIFVPGAQDLLKGIAADLAAMLAPLKAGDAKAARPFEDRRAALVAGLPVAETDTLAAPDIDAMTAARRDAPDSVHLLVMDLHKADQRAGLRNRGRNDRRRARLSCRSAGWCARRRLHARVNRTAALKFGHPGLATTATRVGDRLAIQNDIGTTDAHVLVVHVEIGSREPHPYGRASRPRRNSSSPCSRAKGWRGSRSRRQRAEGLGDDGPFYLVNGTFRSADLADLDAFLEFLGSRIVFLIDWNRARKATASFVGGKERRRDPLRWAAAHDYGHRAFLELGGAELVFEAVRRVAGDRIPYGARLDETLGPAETMAFLRQVLQQASQGLGAGRSARLIRDEIQADLAETFETAEAHALTIVLRNLGLSRMLAARLWDALSGAALPPAPERQALVRRARALEEKADRLTVLARESEARMHKPGEPFRPLIDGVENAMDCLDEGAFLLSIWPDAPPDATILASLAALAAIATESIGHLVRAVAASACLGNGRHVDAQDALRDIDAVLCEERNADVACRQVVASFMAVPCADPRIAMLGADIARMLETSTDHLAHAALSLRDRVIEELAG